MKNQSFKPKIAVVGAGAIGSVVGELSTCLIIIKRR